MARAPSPRIFILQVLVWWVRGKSSGGRREFIHSGGVPWVPLRCMLRPSPLCDRICTVRKGLLSAFRNHPLPCFLSSSEQRAQASEFSKVAPSEETVWVGIREGGLCCWYVCVLGPATQFRCTSSSPLPLYPSPTYSPHSTWDVHFNRIWSEDTSVENPLMSAHHWYQEVPDPRSSSWALMIS